MRSDFLSPEELAAFGFAHVGDGVRVSRHALIFGAQRISLGNSVRIDAFCILSASGIGIRIGNNVHLSAYSALYGQDLIEVGNFATISVRCTLFTSNDDYGGDTMTNPTVPSVFRGVQEGPVIVGAHAIVGANCTVLPNVKIGESAAVGAASLVKKDVPPFAIVAGVPAKVIGQRRTGHRELAEEMLRRNGA